MLAMFKSHIILTLFFFHLTPHNEKTPQISLGRFPFLHVVSNVQIKLHILVAIK